MAKQKIKIQGKLFNQRKEALANLRLEAWDKDLVANDLVGEATSDKNGNFAITFSKDRYEELFLDKKAELYFKVFLGNRLVHSTEKSVHVNVENLDQRIEIVIDKTESGNGNGNGHTVKGVLAFSGFVRHTNGNGVAGLRVTLNEKLIRSNKKIAEAVTDTLGIYSLSTQSLAENAGYVLEVTDDAGKVLALSDVIFNPEENNTLDFIIQEDRFKGDASFKLRQPVLKTYFEQLNVNIDGNNSEKPINFDDVFFVSKQTGLKPRDTFQWLRANELERETKIPAEAFYGIFRQGMSTNARMLSAKSGQEIKQAIVEAAKSSYVSDELVAQADKMVDQWNEYIVGKALDEVPHKMDASLNQILNFAIKDKSTQTKVLNAYVKHEGSLAEFWSGVSKITGDDKSATKIQQALKLSVLSGNQPDMMEALLRKQNGHDVFHDLAAMEKEEWVGLINELSTAKKKSVVPTFIEGKDEKQRVEVYAKQMSETLEVNYPTHNFFGKLSKKATSSAFESPTDVVKFFSNNPTFDLKKTSTVDILKGDTNFNFEGIKDKEAVARSLQSAQRLSSYTNSFKTMYALKADGMDSAYKMVSVPETTFIKKHTTSFGSVEGAHTAYKQAEKNYMQSAAVWAKTHPNLSFSTTTTPTPISDPTLRTMFGTLDACECQHCSSVFSPAAYYTDILNFLYSRTPDVYQEIIRRRPDLVHIELTCENTNTPLPYVDLVNELLENFVLTHATPPQAIPLSYQTSWQAKELAANPEHIQYTAYDELKKAVYPKVLPFNLPLSETRVYLKHLGVQKHQLMASFFAGTKEQAFEDFDISMERLGLSPEEAAILSGEFAGLGIPDFGLWSFYGFDKATGFKPLTDPADSSKQISGGNWDAALTGRVDVFLQQAELQYKEMLTVLLCDTINPVTGTDGDGNPVRAINIVSIDGDNASCELSNLKLTGATTNHLQKIHRFVRLWRKTGWSFYDLDKTARALSLDFGNDVTVNKDRLRKISQAEFLAKHLKTKLENILAFWSDIGTQAYVDYFESEYPPVLPLYAKLFLDKSVLNPVEPAFADPSTLAGTLDTYSATIAAALQISDDEYVEIKNELANNALSLGNLSALYRNVLLAQKMKIPVKEFMALRKLVGVDPFVSPKATFEFLLKADVVKTSGFTVDQLDYLLRHEFVEETSVAPTHDEIGIFLSELRSSLRAIQDLTADDQRNTIVQKFSEKYQVEPLATSLLLQIHVKGIVNPAKAVVEDFRADNFTTSSFLKKYTDGGGKDYEPVFASANPAADPTIVAIPDLFNDVIRIQKIMTIVSKLRLSDTDLKSILVHWNALEAFDLTQLPIIPSAFTFTGFENLIGLIKARDTMPVGSPDFFEIILKAITTPDKNVWLTNLITRTNWDQSSVEALVGDGATTANAGMLKKNFPADFVNGEVILQIKNCLTTLSRIGLGTTLIEDTISPNVDSIVSDAIKNASKAKYDESQWLKLAKPLRDDLREKQREALVAYVVAHANFNPALSKFERWKNSDELYEYMLIDVEMKPISMTSRIKQAICSVQLFIDRVLMNLEHPKSNPAVSPLKLEGGQVEEWNEWRKIYRVWEANRKIFLYPENWIEPELRDDKSPFFKDLETQMRQNELTEENVELAFHSYLEKLDEVARLEVIGMYHQLETDLAEEDDIDILHVYARTYTNPHKYYHRMLEHGEWTAWTKLDIDVDGNHIVPTIFNRKLCLFWLFFTPETEEVENLDPKQVVPPAKRWWKMQIAWSEFRKNKWTAKRLSNEAYYSEKFTSSADFNNYKRSVVLRHWIDDPGNELADSGYDGKLHVYFCGDDGGYIDGNHAGCASFVFENTNTDPDLIEEYQFLSFVSPEDTQYREQRVVSDFTGNDLTLQIPRTFKTTNGYLASKIERLTLLGQTPRGRFKIVTPTNDESPYETEFFFHDKENTFYVAHSTVQIPVWTRPEYSFGDWNHDMVIVWDDIYRNIPINPADPVINPADQLYDPFEPVYDIDDFFSNPMTDTINVAAFNIKGFNSGVVMGGAIDVRNGITNGLTNGFATNSLIENNAVVETAPIATRSSRSGVRVSGISTSVQSQYNYAKRYDLITTGQYIVHKYRAEDRFTFKTFYHGHVKNFVKELYKHGIPGLLNRKLQTKTDTIAFSGTYKPRKLVPTPYPVNSVDFSYGGAYSQYNWELFFHVPMLIACRLKDDQRFEDARKWFHFIFNPTNSEGGDKERFWQFKPFYDEAGTAIETLDDLLKNETELTQQVNKWMDDPFKPHVIARMRISAYMKNVVMKYLDNLIAWGDSLFKRDTIEAINEATNLYILVAKILGEKPQLIPPRATHADATFNDIKDDLDPFSNTMVQIETMIAPSAPASPGSGSGSSNALGKMFYFSVPHNEFILKYWNTVGDRLFKIRNSMNIEGVVRTLPLFEPPIDPAMLVRAAAAGMDLSSILSDMNAPLPHYRFNFMFQKANEFVAEVKGLGSALLQALEKRDGEAISLLRSVHEQKLLKALLDIKEKQVDDAKEQLASVKKSKEIAEVKYNHYNSRPYMNSKEKQQLDSIQTGLIYTVIQGELSSIGGMLSAIPNLKAGAPTSMGVTWGGDNLGAMMNAISTYIGIFASINSAQGSMAGTLGGYDRRMDDWKFQAASTTKEIEQLEKQILSTEIKLAIAEKEVTNQELQIENSIEVDEFMRSKFTNQQLYDWMIGQLSTIYFQSYQLAYDLAKKAEQGYQYELGEFGNSSFIQFGYWDSLKKGLLCAEQLQYDLRRMETSFYDKNKRDLELTKHVSLLLLNPLALQELRENGITTFTLPESVFDLDYPGHYFRRLKSVSVSIPCIVGPYTTVNATLRLLKHTTRISPAPGGGGEYESADYAGDSIRFRHVATGTHSLATSTGQNDSGMFELNFRDERYLPFEGCGVFGEWQLELNTEAELRMFDYNTISDVIMTLQYTAREDGALKALANTYLKSVIQAATTPTPTSSGVELRRMFSIRHEFATEWHKFLHPATTGADQILNLTLRQEHFPYFAHDRKVVVKGIDVMVRATEDGEYKMTAAGKNNSGTAMATSSEVSMPDDVTLPTLNTGVLANATPGFNVSQLDILAPMSFKFKHSTDSDFHSIGTSPDEFSDMIFIVKYQLED